MKKNRKLALKKITIAAMKNNRILKGGTGDTGTCVPDTYVECHTIGCDTNIICTNTCNTDPFDHCAVTFTITMPVDHTRTCPD